MIDIIAKLWKIFTKREKRSVVSLSITLVLAGLFEAVGVASVMPLIVVLTNQNSIHKNIYINYIYSLLGFSSANDFLVFLCAFVLFLVVGSQLLKIVAMWGVYHFSFLRLHAISTRLLNNYLYHPYAWFLNKNSAELTKSVLAEVEMVIGYILAPALRFIGSAATVILVMSLLIIVDPLVALSAVAILGGSYFIIYFIMRKLINKYAAKRFTSNKDRYHIAQEALGGIKEVKVGNHEQAYLKRFNKPSLSYSRQHAKVSVLSELPRYLLEAILIGCVLLLIITKLVGHDESLSSILPMLGVYVFAGLKLLPAMHQMYIQLTKIRFGKPAIDSLAEEMANGVSCIEAEEILWGEKELKISREIRLDRVTFTYPGSDRSALKEFTLAIEKNTTVGLVGSTGAGKTTTVDLILGLLEPQIGNLRVDETDINHRNVTSWQKILGYIPQHIFLADDTVSSNIAFGVPEDRINMQAVIRAAEIAEIHQFITNEMPDGYDTIVGERGVRLSGGQRQRIGIARALYLDPEVLILDEATSALDNLTEKAVMESVKNIGSQKTIIIIAHRLSTIMNCDTIHMLSKGNLVASGSYNELFSGNEEFRMLADN